MSLDASVYTPDDTPIPRDELVRAASDAGWVLWTVHDIFEPSRFRTVLGGNLSNADYFYGWRATDPNAKDNAKALTSRQVNQLERWAQVDPDRQLGAAFVHVNPYLHEYSPSQDGELVAENGSEYLAALKVAKLEYLVDLHANNDDFRIDMARVICRMRGGLWVDHLGGEWSVEGAKQSRTKDSS